MSYKSFAVTPDPAVLKPEMNLMNNLHSHSPISQLAHELEENLLVAPDVDTKTPRRCLLDILSKSVDSPSDVSILSTSPANSTASSNIGSPLPDTPKVPTRLFKDKKINPKPEFSPSFKFRDLLLDLDINTKSSLTKESPNPFKNSNEYNQSPLCSPKKKSTLKFKDQNQMKPPRPIGLSDFTQFNKMKVSHWNHRKAAGLAKQHSVQDVSIGIRRKCEDEPDSERVAIGLVRSNSNSNIPPRKIRRSMTFNGAENMTVLNQNVLHPPPDDLFSQPVPILPSIIEDGKDMIRRITANTLVNIINGQFSEKMDEFYLVDCRYPYEYQGGHIESAINITTVEEIEKRFFSKLTLKKIAIVFHCEYSIQRAPQMALHFRSIDRNLNRDFYPKLNYPDIYILKGGYRDFYGQHTIRCTPMNYIEMNDPRFVQECKEGMCLQKRQFRKCFSEGFLR
ncbi:cell division cycle- protein [Terramyces sp. JEL0728]|nr:cell division cycle- protein [Terramyces sp. JEL0728]